MLETEIVEQNVDIEQDEDINTQESILQTQNINGLVPDITTAVQDVSDTRSEDNVPVTKQDTSVITDIDSKAWESLTQHISAQQELIETLKSELKVVITPAAKMEGDDEQTHFILGYHLILCSRHC